MAVLSGKSGSISIGGSNYAFGKWEADFNNDLPDVTNFNSGGCEENISGIDRCNINAEGPYNAGSMPLTVGTAYVFILRASSGVTWTVTARISNLKPITDHKDAVRLAITARSTAVFTPAVT